MDASESKDKEISTRIGNRIDISTEFREGFDYSSSTERSIKQALLLQLETNPIERIYKPVADAPDDIKKDVVERVKKTTQIWLDNYDALLTESKSLAVDLIGYAADLARQRRNGLKK